MQLSLIRYLCKAGGDSQRVASRGELQKAAAAKDSEIQVLKAKLDEGENASDVAVELAEAKLAAKLAEDG